MQTAKVFSGDLEKAVNESKKVSETMGSLITSADGMQGADLTDTAAMRKAEKLLEDMDDASTQGLSAAEEMQQLLGKAFPANFTRLENASSKMDLATSTLSLRCGYTQRRAEASIWESTFPVAGLAATSPPKA